MVVLQERVKNISRERLDFDIAFLVEALEEQKAELRKLSKATGVHISPANE